MSAVFGAKTARVESLASASMGKKSFEDGEVPASLNMREIVDEWAKAPEIIDLLLKGRRLLVAADGKPTKPCKIHANLKNIAANAPALMPLAKQMRSLHRLSAYPVELYQTALSTFYDRHRHLYKEESMPENSPVFNPFTWAFEEGWVIHKMFSRLRNKVLRPETPRVPCLQLVVFVGLSYALNFANKP